MRRTTLLMTATALVIAGMAVALVTMRARLVHLEARQSTPARVVAPTPPRIVERALPARIQGRIADLEAQVRALTARLDAPEHVIVTEVEPVAPPTSTVGDVLDADLLHTLTTEFGAFDADRDGGLSADEIAISPDALAVVDLDRDHRLIVLSGQIDTRSLVPCPDAGVANPRRHLRHRLRYGALASEHGPARIQYRFDRKARSPPTRSSG